MDTSMPSNSLDLAKLIELRNMLEQYHKSEETTLAKTYLEKLIARRIQNLI